MPLLRPDVTTRKNHQKQERLTEHPITATVDEASDGLAV